MEAEGAIAGIENIEQRISKMQGEMQGINARLEAAVKLADGSAYPTASAAKPAAAKKEPRTKETAMSAEVVDSNPYSRLMALQRMGIVSNYQAIRQKRVAIVGIGGVGSVAAEMLTRCGIGSLLLFDYDKVELANMNRLFFRPEQSGMTKTAAATETLININPDVELEGHTLNITTLNGFDEFKRILSDDTDKSRVDLVLSCVDNYEARMTINQVCLELNQTWLESGVSEDAVSGHIQLLQPGITACFACVPPLVVASGIDERTLKREGVCAASLPTTMGIIAGLLVQHALKLLLKFGEVTPYVGYSSLKDFFPTMSLKPNESCSNGLCCKLQSSQPTSELATTNPAADVDESSPFHEDNEWGIEVAPEAEAASSPALGEQALPEGLSYSLPVQQPAQSEVAPDAEEHMDNTEPSLEDLMQQLETASSSNKGDSKAH
ncbi:hypothetical protein WJX74_003425 [Apatococcus lobatus]|uniref:Ubiquitin-like modifier-activating enzyme 5 n=2 Tax=Apatococcus TaxID=904362 RepID=A0AAW1RK98_9CHLO